MKKAYRFETHFHTKESSPCGCVPAAESVRKYYESGYDGIVITDHFSAGVLGSEGGTSWQTAMDRFLKGYWAAKNEGEKLGLTILLGAEFRFPGNYNDFLVYGLSEDFLRGWEWLYEASLQSFFPIADKLGFAVVQAHPFRAECYRENPAYLHGIEVFNGNPRHNSKNMLAKEWAQKYGLLESAGSDFHKMEDLAGASVLLGKRPRTSLEFAHLLRERAYRLETRRKL